MADDHPETNTAPGTVGSAAGASNPSVSPAAQQAPREMIGPLSQGAPVSPAAPVSEKNIGADIAKILKEVKLPERRAHETPTAPEGQAPAMGVSPQMEPRPAPATAPIAPITPAAPAAAIPAVVVPPQNPAPITVPAAPPSERPQAVTPPFNTAPNTSPITVPNTSQVMRPNEPLKAVITPPAPAQPEDGVASPIQSLHTMKDDLQTTVRERKISVVRAASMEQDRRHEAPAPMIIEASRRGGKIGLILTSILVLLALGAAALYAVQLLAGGNAAHTQAPATTSVVFAENQVSFSLGDQSSAALRQTLGGLLAQFTGSVGSITQVVPTLSAADTQTGQRAATLPEFFTALGAGAPDTLVRALGSDFFFGIHMADAPSPVFIIPVVSYDNAFAGMLAWESTIDTSLAPLFKQVPAVAASPQGGLPVARQFKDLVVRNYDVRALEDDSGAIVLYYSFPTPQLLIIAASPYTFPEVLSRLQAERKL